MIRIFVDASLKQKTMGIGLFYMNSTHGLPRFSNKHDLTSKIPPNIVKTNTSAVKISDGLMDINRGELGAIYYALDSFRNSNEVLHIYTDSLNTKRMIHGEMRVNKKFHDLLDVTIHTIRNRWNDTRVHWIRGHSNIQGNIIADKMATWGREYGKSYTLPDNAYSEK